jgi:hypothetical protein
MYRGLALVVVTAIAHVHMRLSDAIPDHAPDLLHLLGQGVAIIGIAGKALGAHQPSAPAGDCDTDLIAELVRLARLALGDAFDLGLVNAVDLVLVLPLLSMDAMRRRQ